MAEIPGEGGLSAPDCAAAAAADATACSKESEGRKSSLRQREEAGEKLTDELARLEEKLKLTESLLESKNLEIKKINEEKRASMAALLAAETTLRRVHAALKDYDMPPMEAELKRAHQEIEKLQEDNRVLDRLTKQREVTSLDADRRVQDAREKATLVDDLQNKNQELMKQIGICQRENKIIDKMLRQKVAEVEKNEDRTFLQGEMQQLRDKLAIAERAAKSEAQLKEKLHLRVKELEDMLRGASSSSARNTSEGRSMSNAPSRRQSLGGADNIQKLASNFLSKKNPVHGCQLRHSSSFDSTSVSKNNAKGASKSSEGGTKSSGWGKALLCGPGNYSFNKASGEAKETEEKPQSESPAAPAAEDSVSRVMYGSLQEEITALRRASQEKEQSLRDKDGVIETLAKKVEILTKAMEVAANKTREG